MAGAPQEHAQLVHPARILVSSTRKPISYINLAKRFLQEHGEVRITALGIAVAPAVTVAEILKNRHLATERQIVTALESVGDQARARHKPKIDILLVKSAEFDDIIAGESQPLPDLNAPSSSAAAAEMQESEQGEITRDSSSTAQRAPRSAGLS